MEVSTGVITDIKRDLNTTANRKAKPDNLKTQRKHIKKNFSFFYEFKFKPN